MTEWYVISLMCASLHLPFLFLLTYCMKGDTLENVAQELDCIINTGNYTFHLRDTEGQMFLEYKFHTSQMDSDADPICRKMNGEQIRDFVRKLGFLDKDKDEDGAQKIKHFLHHNQVSHTHQYNIMNAYMLHVSDYFQAVGAVLETVRVRPPILSCW